MDDRQYVKFQAYAVMEHSMGEAGRARKLFEAGVERCRDHVQLHQVRGEGEETLKGRRRAQEVDTERLVLDGDLTFLS